MAPSDKTETDVGPIITSSLAAATRLRIIVVGAGGTGGRLIPPLMQVLRQGDSVAIMDGDHVEDRNLARQNFRARDVGENKAEVMARRYQRDGIEVNAFASMLSMDNWRSVIAAPTNHLVFLGCVDNPTARVTIQTIMRQTRALWIDGGNEMRGGQVILSSTRWPFKVTAKNGNKIEGPIAGEWHLDGMLAMPQLLKPQPWRCDRCEIDNPAGAPNCSSCKQPEATCQNRVDLQTVAVNQLSATCILNTLSCILYGIPMTTCGAFFSTLNTMSPIKLKSVTWDKALIIPDKVYASE